MIWRDNNPSPGPALVMWNWQQSANILSHLRSCHHNHHHPCPKYPNYYPWSPVLHICIADLLPPARGPVPSFWIKLTTSRVFSNNYQPTPSCWDDNKHDFAKMMWWCPRYNPGIVVCLVWLGTMVSDHRQAPVAPVAGQDKLHEITKPLNTATCPHTSHPRGSPSRDRPRPWAPWLMNRDR